MPLTKAEQLTRRMPKIDISSDLRRLEMSRYTVDAEWVINAMLSDIVRLGTGAEDLETHYPKLRHIPARQLSEEECALLNTTIDDSGEIQPSRERYQHLQRQYQLPQQYDRTAQTLSVLLHPFFRKGSFELMGAEYIRTLHNQIRSCLLNRTPLQIIVPTLPFKDQCAVTTRQPILTVDLGERLMMMRFNMLGRSLQAVSQLPTTIHIVSDGNVYADIFTQSGRSQVNEYLNSCQQLITDFNLHHLKISDMSQIVERESEFEHVQMQTRAYLSEAVEENNPALSEVWPALLRGMLFNCQLPQPFHEYESFTTLAASSLTELRDSHHEVYQVISHAAQEYASFLLTMRRLSVLQRAFPERGTIRATVHPKKSQLGLHTLGSEVAPYNGVTSLHLAELRRDPRITNEKLYDCQRFYRLLESAHEITQLLDQRGNVLGYLHQ